MAKFKPPDEASLKRMTKQSVESLLETLRSQRAAKVELIDQEILFYETKLAQIQTKETLRA